jgi:patatin-like phospholipase/acyl hydrolase
LDGGGLRGVISLAIIEMLDAAVPGWRDKINMYAGTSTGGLIALGLAKGFTPAQIMDVYMTEGPKIFDRSLWHEIANLGEVTGPKYDSDNRMTTVRGMFGNDRLRDTKKNAHVVITAFDLVNSHAANPAGRTWKPKIFHNVPAKTPADSDGQEYAWRVAMYTSAAPTYFASYEGYVDGGVFANNPAMCALAQAMDKRNVAPQQLTNIRLLSIGTGVRPYHLDGDESWGLAQWAPKLVDLLMDGVNEVAAFQVKQLLEERYQRINVDLTADIPMDAVTMLGTMQRVGNGADTTAAVAFLKDPKRW